MRKLTGERQYVVWADISTLSEAVLLLWVYFITHTLTLMSKVENSAQILSFYLNSVFLSFLIPGPNDIKLFCLWFMNFCHKLKCLSLPSFSSSVYTNTPAWYENLKIMDNKFYSICTSTTRHRRDDYPYINFLFDYFIEFGLLSIVILSCLCFFSSF